MVQKSESKKETSLESSPEVIQAAMDHNQVIPQAVDLEDAILGGMMLQQDVVDEVIAMLSPDCFYKKANKIIYEAINALALEGQPIDALTVRNELHRTKKLESVGGSYHLSQLTTNIARATNIDFYVRVVQQKYIMRKIITFASQSTKQAFDPSIDPIELINDVQAQIDRIGENVFHETETSINLLAKEIMADIEKAMQTVSGITGVDLKFNELNKMTAGGQSGDMIIIAARPGMGKTAFVLCLAIHIAINSNQPIAIFSLEMEKKVLVMRIVSILTGYSYDNIRKGRLGSEEVKKVHETILSINNNLIIDDNPTLNNVILRAKIRKYRKKYGIKMAIIDYLQLMEAHGGYHGKREEEVSKISRSVKIAAKENNIPVIALSQLSREVDKRSATNKIPVLSDLRESGSIEQDADIVMFLYRPEYYKIFKDEDGNNLRGLAKVVIAKNRNGDTGEFNIKFDGPCMRFEDIEGNQLTIDTSSSNEDFQVDEDLAF